MHQCLYVQKALSEISGTLKECDKHLSNFTAHAIGNSFHTFINTYCL